MSVYFNKAKGCWHWQFEKTINGQRHRLGELLPKAWSESTARKFDDKASAAAYTRLSNKKAEAPPISLAVQKYLTEKLPGQRDSVNSARNLQKHLYAYYHDRTLDQLGELSREYIEDTDDLAPATVRQRLATLRSACSHALKKHGIGSRDWIEQIQMPAVDNARKVFLSRREVLTLARACTHPATRALILMTFATGARPGELAKAEPFGDHFERRLKKGYQSMVVPLQFRHLMRHWPLDYDYSRLSFHFRRARRLVFMDHVHFHDLRHSTASALLEAGATLAEVGEILNHTSVQSTKRYIHLSLGGRHRTMHKIWPKQVGEILPYLGAPRAPRALLREENEGVQGERGTDS